MELLDPGLVREVSHIMGDKNEEGEVHSINEKKKKKNCGVIKNRKKNKNTMKDFIIQIKPDSRAEKSHMRKCLSERLLITRHYYACVCMMNAVYVCIGTQPESNGVSARERDHLTDS